MNRGNNRKQSYSNRGGPAKYQSYASKKNLKVQEVQSRRELNIKSRYKKLLRKELRQEESHSPVQLNRNSVSGGGAAHHHVFTNENNSQNHKQSNSSFEQNHDDGRQSKNDSSRRGLLKSNSADWIEVSVSESESRKDLKPSGWTVTSVDSSDSRRRSKAEVLGWTSSPASENKSVQPRNSSSGPSGWTDVSKEINFKDGKGILANATAGHHQLAGREIFNQNMPNKNSAQNSQERYQNKTEDSRGQRGKPSALKKAQNAYSMKNQDRAQKESMFKRQQEERQIAIQSRKKRRLEKFKVLNQKTSKGQPVMKGRMQMLLQKIQSSL